jgi:hypothetical protein
MIEKCRIHSSVIPKGSLPIKAVAAASVTDSGKFYRRFLTLASVAVAAVAATPVLPAGRHRTISKARRPWGGGGMVSIDLISSYFFFHFEGITGI